MDAKKMIEIHKKSITTGILATTKLHFLYYIWLLKIKNCNVISNGHGFMILDKNTISVMAVDPNYQNKGIGTELMNNAKLLYHNLEVETASATKFYQKNGFEIISTNKIGWTKLEWGN